MPAGPSELDQVVRQCETILAQCLIAANAAAEAVASIGTAGLAPLASPAFTGTPTAPTPPDGDASTRVATTAFLGSKLGQPLGIATLDVSGLIPLAQLPLQALTYDGPWNANTNTPTLTSSSGTAGHFFVVTVAGTANLNGINTWDPGDWALFGSGVWTRIPYVTPSISNLPLTSLEAIADGTLVANISGGSSTPMAITIASITSRLSVAVGDGGSGGSVGLVPAPPPGSAGSGAFLRADMVYAVPSGPNLSAYALLNSPTFTGTATVPTQARDLSATAIANTQFVIQQLAGSDEVGLIGVNGTASAGTSTHGARVDHIHGTDTSRAAAANPQMSGPSGQYNGTLTITSLVATAIAASALNGTMTGVRTLSGTTTILGTLGGTVVAEANLVLVDGTVGNATTGRHGFLPKLSGNSTDVLSGTGGFVALASGLVSAQVITTTGSQPITIPAGATKLKVVLQGGGGGGGGADGTGVPRIGFPGGGGARLIKYLTSLTPGNTLNLTVGGSGTAGSSGGGSGGVGGNTVLSSGTQSITTLTAAGGSGGTGNQESPSSTTTAGGTATNGDINVTGIRGVYMSSGGFNGGGDSDFGVGGVEFTGTVSSNPGVAGSGRGAGGSGASSGSPGNAAGGAGTAGLAIFEWYA